MNEALDFISGVYILNKLTYTPSTFFREKEIWQEKEL